jgi:hypothetical protein
MKEMSPHYVNVRASAPVKLVEVLVLPERLRDLGH